MVIPPSCCKTETLNTPVTQQENALHPLVQCVYYASSHYSNFSNVSIIQVNLFKAVDQ